MDLAPKYEPVITPFNAYSQRTDLYLPSFYKKPQTKQKDLDVRLVEYSQLPQAVRSDDLTGGQTNQERSGCAIWKSCENIVLDEERHFAEMAYPPCSASEKSEIAVTPTDNKIVVDNKFTTFPVEHGGTSASNGHLEQNSTLELHPDLNETDYAWTEDSHENAYQEVPRISASRQASLLCVAFVLCMDQVHVLSLLYWRCMQICMYHCRVI